MTFAVIETLADFQVFQTMYKTKHDTPTKLPVFWNLSTGEKHDENSFFMKVRNNYIEYTIVSAYKILDDWRKTLNLVKKA